MKLHKGLRKAGRDEFDGVVNQDLVNVGWSHITGTATILEDGAGVSGVAYSSAVGGGGVVYLLDNTELNIRRQIQTDVIVYNDNFRAGICLSHYGLPAHRRYVILEIHKGAGGAEALKYRYASGGAPVGGYLTAITAGQWNTIIGTLIGITVYWKIYNPLMGWKTGSFQCAPGCWSKESDPAGLWYSPPNLTFSPGPHVKWDNYKEDLIQKQEVILCQE